MRVGRSRRPTSRQGLGSWASTPRDDSNGAGLAQVVADLGAVAAWLPSITQIIGAPDWQVLGLAQTTAVLVKRLEAIGTGCAEYWINA